MCHSQSRQLPLQVGKDGSAEGREEEIDGRGSGA